VLPIPLRITIKQLAVRKRPGRTKLAGSQAEQRRGERRRFSASHASKTTSSEI